jgi:hypothetical protein
MLEILAGLSIAAPVRMTTKLRIRSAGRRLAYGAGLAAGACAAYIGATWLRYGRPPTATGDDRDPLLDRFIPAYDVVDRYHATVAAPADIAFAAACEIHLQQSAIIRAIFSGRELLLRSAPDPTTRPPGLMAWTRSMGWGVLAEVPGREIVVGAVTRPWDANPVFRTLPPEDFAAFDEPDYVKIVWTMRADPAGAQTSVVRHETRAIATDARARRKFRTYWSFLSPGIILIRRVALGLVTRDAEAAARKIALSTTEDVEGTR